MSEILLTKELLAKIGTLPGKQRASLLKRIGEQEWQKCSRDMLYWLDTSRHPWMTYVYTQDPHPLHVCLLCKDNATYHFNKRSDHLEARHGVHVKGFQEIAAYFTELSTVRSFTVMPYMPPIIDTWLSEQFVFIEKSRDMMATWLTVAMYTWDTLFHEGRQNIFQSEDGMKTQELVKRANFIYKNQPKFLRDVHKAVFGAGVGRAGQLLLPSLNSEILGFPQGPDQIRQYHPSGVFQDEAAFQMEAGAAFRAIKPAIQAGGRFTAVSSANPSWFYLATADLTDEAQN
jgi:hypothetical protein